MRVLDVLHGARELRAADLTNKLTHQDSPDQKSRETWHFLQRRTMTTTWFPWKSRVQDCQNKGREDRQVPYI